MLVVFTGCFLGRRRGALGALAAALLAATSAGAADSVPPFDFDVPVSYAQLASVSVPRARAEAIPGVALGEPDALASPGPAFTTRAWTSGFAFSSRVGADRNGPAQRSSGGGATIGVDRLVDPTFLVGLALTYSHGDTTSIGTKSETDTVSGAVYGAWIPYPGLEFEGLFGIDRSEIDSRHFVGTAAQTHGETNSFGVSALGNVGYRFRFETGAGDAFFKPFVGASYSSQDRDAYAEFGASGIDLVFPSKTFERSTFNLGAATGINFAAGGGWIVRPELRVAWSHYLTDPTPPVPVLLAGVPLVLRDPNPGRDGAVVALEVTGITAGLQVFAGYAGEFRSNSTAHHGRVGLRVTW